MDPEKEPLRDPAGNPLAVQREEDTWGKGIESDNEPIDADDTDLPDDEVDPSDHVVVDHDAWPEPT